MKKTEETIKKHISTIGLTPLQWVGLLKAMGEYGKYCAEEAFSAGFREGKEYYPSTFSEFWSEFQKEGTK